MAFGSLKRVIDKQLAEIRSAGLYKAERQILGPQGSEIRVAQGEVLNLCANNYLGLANHPDVRHAAAEGLRRYGYGLASVRFICGTQDLHKRLEGTIARFLGKEDDILISSCWDANGGLFETIHEDDDTVLADEINHVRIIDCVRLCQTLR